MGGRLVLRGISGLVEGENFIVHQGESVIIGRSRSADICLQNCKNYRKLPISEQDEQKHFQTVSRKHVCISYHSDVELEIEDLSANGTYVDGEQIDHIIISNIQEESHILLLGTREKLVIEWEPDY